MTDDCIAEQFRALRARIEQVLPEFSGMRIEKAAERARQLDIDLRVIQLHENAWHTSDARSNRVTVEVENGVLTSARIA